MGDLEVSCCCSVIACLEQLSKGKYDNRKHLEVIREFLKSGSFGEKARTIMDRQQGPVLFCMENLKNCVSVIQKHPRRWDFLENHVETFMDLLREVLSPMAEQALDEQDVKSSEEELRHLLGLEKDSERSEKIQRLTRFLRVANENFLAKQTLERLSE